MKNYYAININWETDGQDVSLPEQVEIPNDIPTDEVADYLSNKYGWLVNDFNISNYDNQKTDINGFTDLDIIEIVENGGLENWPNAKEYIKKQYNILKYDQTKIVKKPVEFGDEITITVQHNGKNYSGCLTEDN